MASKYSRARLLPGGYAASNRRLYALVVWTEPGNDSEQSDFEFHVVLLIRWGGPVGLRVWLDI